jgi:Ca-activated chloride channel family protein
MNNPYHDDPRLTAYALGELEGDERRDVERLLAESPAARDAVEEIRGIAVELTAHLQAEPMPALTSQQRSVVMSGPQPSRPSRSSSREPVRSGNAAVVAAACLMLLAAGWIMSFSEKERDSGTAAPGKQTVTLEEQQRQIAASKTPPGDAAFGEQFGKEVAGVDFDKSIRDLRRVQLRGGQPQAGGTSGSTDATPSGTKTGRFFNSPPTHNLPGSYSRSGSIAGLAAPQNRTINTPQSASRFRLQGQAAWGYPVAGTPVGLPGPPHLPLLGTLSDPMSLKEHKEWADRFSRRNVLSRTETLRAVQPFPGMQGETLGEGLLLGGRGFPAEFENGKRLKERLRDLNKRKPVADTKTGQNGQQVQQGTQKGDDNKGSGKGDPKSEPPSKKQAVGSYRKAIELNPKAATAYANLGSALHGQGKYDEAVACFRKAIALDPKDAAAHYHLGRVFEAQKKREEAIACYRKAIELNPQYALASKKQAIESASVEWFAAKDVKLVRENVVKQFDQLAKQHPKRELAILRVKTRLNDRLQGLERQVALAERGGQRIAAVEGRVILGEAVRQEVRTLDVDGDGRADFGGEGFDAIVENTFLTPLANPLSTFSIDVDTASYSNVRRYIDAGALPPRNAVRVEEFVNYFRYDYPQPTSKDPFSVTLEAGPCPWNVKHRLVLIGLKGREIPHDKRPPANLVFLIDVSGSMQSANRLPLVKIGLEMLVDQLRGKDRVSIVTYSNTARIVLEPTAGNKRDELLKAIHSLNASGSTNGAAGIQMAYEQAQKAFAKTGSNRVILCTDGDFNVGVSSDDALVKLIQEKAKSKVFLSVFGFGMGNTKHAKLEKIANKGNGHYAYIDKFQEAKKVFVEEMSGTLYTIAKDVKIQVEFNPAKVASYRLVGYENRMLAAQDFNNDKKDAGEIGAGHTVTALYEIVPVDAKNAKPAVDDLKYQKRVVADKAKPVTQESLTVKLRYKQPEGDKSTKIEFALKDDPAKKKLPSENFDFASAVAMYGLLLRDSKYAGNASLDLVRELAAGAIGKDPEGRRSEFIKLVQKTESYVASQLGKPIPAGKPKKPAAK